MPPKSPFSYMTIVSAAIDAVSARKIRFPIDILLNPASLHNCTSSGAKPPSGPIKIRYFLLSADL